MNKQDLIQENLTLTKAINKLERKHKRELENARQKGRDEQARVLRAVKYICPNCKTEMVIKRTLKG